MPLSAIPSQNIMLREKILAPEWDKKKHRRMFLECFGDAVPYV